MKTYVITETSKYEIKAKSHEGARGAFLEMSAAQRDTLRVAILDMTVTIKSEWRNQ